MNKKTLQTYMSAIFLPAILMTSPACSDDGGTSAEEKKENHVVHTEQHDAQENHVAHAEQHDATDNPQHQHEEREPKVTTQDVTGLYKELSTPQPTTTGDKIEVSEIFWYGCPHCYQFEPTINKWLKEKAEYIEFVRIPGMLGSQWVSHARAYYAAEKLGVLEKIHQPLFHAIHDEKRAILDEKSLRNFFTEHGITGNDFDQAFHSKEVEDKVRAAFLTGKNYGLTGVPAITINGKYTTSVSMAGSFKKVIDVINNLSAKEYERLQQ